ADVGPVDALAQLLRETCRGPRLIRERHVPADPPARIDPDDVPVVVNDEERSDEGSTKEPLLGSREVGLRYEAVEHESRNHPQRHRETRQAGLEIAAVDELVRLREERALELRRRSVLGNEERAMDRLEIDRRSPEHRHGEA